MNVPLDAVLDIVGCGIDELELQIARLVRDSGLRLVGVTGPSSVGKSTFVAGMVPSIKPAGSVEVIRGDDFLESGLRGSSSYRSANGNPLTPDDFTFGQLRNTLDELERDRTVTRWGYERGVGWDDHTVSRPADFYIVEGLFLDSVRAASFIKFDLLVVLETSWTVIAELRRRRDASVRDKLGIGFRTAAETEHEIAQTRMAYANYDRPSMLSNRITVTVDSQFTVENISLG